MLKRKTDPTRYLIAALITGLIAAAVILALKAERVPGATAAVDCGADYELRIEITDNGRPNVNGGLLSLPGAVIDFSRNPQSGSFDSVDYVDNGAQDDEKTRYGVIEERTACSADDADYTLTLEFRSVLSCEVIGDPVQSIDLQEDTLVEFTVDDCERVEPTPTPTATKTATPTQTPVATQTPVPTATSLPAAPAPLIAACPGGQLVNLTLGQQCPQPTVAPVAPTLAPSFGIITPPSTGSAGLQGQ